ncbi:MAG: hypothetical protein IT375_28215 [Polyangiaceae bacterium]|nr:hypothetical protein [Polyangiaceae bacterium]MCK6531558.1 hypothetical protein [Polyangiaceae bacterium]
MNRLIQGSCLVLGLLAACGGPPPTAAKPPEPAGAAPAAAEPPAAPAEEAAPAVPRAQIIEVLPGKSSPDDRRVKIRFDNPTTSPCTFTSYTLVWSGGRKTIEEKPFVIPPGGKRERALVVHPNDGDLAKLKVEGSEVEVNAGCSKE